MNIGIVGQGYVGTAVKTIFEKYYNVLTYDLDKDKSSCGSILEMVVNTDIIFVCVPTPMNKDGSCNLDIVEDVIEKINLVGKEDTIVAIKSTVTPGTTNRLNKQYNYLSIVFNPEFLTEVNFIDDFKNQNRIIIGGPRPATTKVRRLYKKAFPRVAIIKTGSTVAEMVKYFTNCFLATKVSFANEMYQICNKLEIDYDKVIEYTQYDSRIGNSHLEVPGPDGDFGYGGHCFPKDVKALIDVTINLGIQPHILMATDNKNNIIRKNRDWEKQKGRAII